MILTKMRKIKLKVKMMIFIKIKENQRIFIKQTDYLEASWNEILEQGFKFDSAFNLDYNQSDIIARYLTKKLSSVNTLYI